VLQSHFSCESRRVFFIAVVILLGTSLGQPFARANSSSDRCAGYGDLQSISLTDWESGLGTWTVGTHDTESDFDTPDWTVVGNLPDERPGMAAFVADQDNGDCSAEDKSGALTLDSPPIKIPEGAEVPRISIDHWYATEFGWDGGNLKIRINGGAFNLIPAAAIATGPYNSTLFPPIKDGGPYNTNPLAGEEAFSGTYDGQITGNWRQMRINLLGIAAAGDTIQLRFDFGVDQCGGNIGWYVDDVEFYNCEAELPPSDCGNSVIDSGEQCDDGNNFIDDGCSNICQIEEGWECADPTPPGNIPDPSFEGGTPNSYWSEFSSTPDGSPICDAALCGKGRGSGPFDGVFWVWFGGTSQLQEGSVSQLVVIPATVTELRFELEIPFCDSASDYLEVLIDGKQVFFVDGSNTLCGIVGYTTQTVDISAYANGGVHEIKFHSETFSASGSISNFFIDVISLPGSASVCVLDKGTVFIDGFE